MVDKESHNAEVTPKEKLQHQVTFERDSTEKYRRPDDAIFREVCDLIVGNGQLNSTEIKVHVENGRVTLSGLVDSVENKRLAEDVPVALLDGIAGSFLANQRAVD